MEQNSKCLTGHQYYLYPGSFLYILLSSHHFFSLLQSSQTKIRNKTESNVHLDALHLIDLTPRFDSLTPLEVAVVVAYMYLEAQSCPTIYLHHHRHTCLLKSKSQTENPTFFTTLVLPVVAITCLAWREKRRKEQRGEEESEEGRRNRSEVYRSPQKRENCTFLG